jgi:hypothetical protein
MTRYATVTTTTTAIAHTGSGYHLPAGRYEVAELDGVEERGEMYIHGPENGELMAINPRDPHITISQEG